MQDITYDVRVYGIERRKNAAGKVITYRVLWRVAGTLFRETYKKKAQADSFRSELVAAVNKAQAFSTQTGQPVAWKQTINHMSWYEFACDYADMKWKDASAKHRADIARVLMLATPALLSSERCKPDDKAMRRALCRWGFNTKQRADAPADVAQVLQWVARNTRNVEILADGEMLRTVLDTVTTRRDGKRMAAVTTKKYRGILHNALEYAVVRKALTENALTA